MNWKIVLNKLLILLGLAIYTIIILLNLDIFTNIVLSLKELWTREWWFILIGTLNIYIGAKE